MKFEDPQNLGDFLRIVILICIVGVLLAYL